MNGQMRKEGYESEFNDRKIKVLYVCGKTGGGGGGGGSDGREALYNCHK